MQGFKTIDDLLTAKEGEHLQFKEAKSRFDFTEALKVCCALANGGGGLLVLGITDKRPRQVVGSLAFPQPEEARRGLIEKLNTDVDFQELFFEGRRVLEFSADPHPVGRPVLADGVAWWYSGDRLIPMPENVRRRIYEEATIDFSNNICEGARLDDLDTTAVNNFREKYLATPAGARFRNKTTEELLRGCEVMKDNALTYAAIILFGTAAAIQKFRPQAEVVFEYRSSEQAGPASYTQHFSAGFFSYYDQLWGLINIRNDAQHYQDGFFVYDIPTFNERVVREAILNAVCHRDYQDTGGIFLRQYRDRLVVQSPGGFPNGVTVDNLFENPRPRNRLVAEMLRRCGLVERAGQGMGIMFEESIKEAKQLPSFQGTNDYNVRLTLNGIILDKKMLALITKIGNDRLSNLATADFLIINDLYHEKPLRKDLRPHLKGLIAMGLVEHAGSQKYILARSLYAAAGKPGVHTRVAGLDRETNKQLILKHIRESGNGGAAFKEFRQVLPSHSDGQIKALLRDLSRENSIYVSGKTSAARWFAKEILPHHNS